MRLSRALQVLPSALVVALAIAAVTLTVRKTLPDRLSNLGAIEILAAAAALVLIALLAVMLRRLSPSAGTTGSPTRWRSKRSPARIARR